MEKFTVKLGVGSKEDLSFALSKKIHLYFNTNGRLLELFKITSHYIEKVNTKITCYWITLHWCSKSLKEYKLLPGLYKELVDLMESLDIPITSISIFKNYKRIRK